MKYSHEFEVDAPIDQVVDFHSRSASMSQITPPPLITQIHQAPTVLNDGDEISFTLWLGPCPIHWRASIERTSATGFTDRQISGPFAKWEHHHTFVAIDNGRTTVHDEITAEVKASLYWRLIGMVMWLNMPILFAFRGWKTRRILG